VTKLSPTSLDRNSFVPLYYQLQELLKQQIESGVWRTGDALPSEPQLAARLGVSRVVVRQALAILEDDRQIIRVRGRGTFVAPPKLEHRAGGLSRLLAAPRERDLTIHVLDSQAVPGERSIRDRLQVDEADEVLRITTLLSHRGVSLAISYSFFRRADVEWLKKLAHVGRDLPPDVVLGDHGLALTRSEVAIEASQCGQFEADRFGIAVHAPVFLVLCREFHRTNGDEAPLEVARVEYRADLLQFRLGLGADDAQGELSATLAMSTEPALAAST
jgi:GntR family transcriptional regulator